MAKKLTGVNLREERNVVAPNDVVLRSGRSLPMGGERWEIRDSGVPVQFVNLLTQLTQFNGVIYLDLASTVQDAGNAPIASIAGRFRMDITTAQSLHKYLGDAINDAIKGPDKSKAN